MKFTSDRIYIRPFVLEDVQALLDLRVRNRQFFQPFEPIQSEEHFTYEGQLQAIQKCIQNFATDAGYAFGIFHQETDALIGRVNLSNISRGAFQSCTIGYYLDQTCNNHGYMTKAVQLVTQFAFGNASLHRLQAAVMPHNQPSIRVIEKLNFQYEGLARFYLCINGKWEDHKIYSLTKEMLKKIK